MCDSYPSIIIASSVVSPLSSGLECKEIIKWQYVNYRWDTIMTKCKTVLVRTLLQYQNCFNVSTTLIEHTARHGKFCCKNGNILVKCLVAVK